MSALRRAIGRKEVIIGLLLFLVAVTENVTYSVAPVLVLFSSVVQQ